MLPSDYYEAFAYGWCIVLLICTEDLITCMLTFFICNKMTEKAGCFTSFTFIHVAKYNIHTFKICFYANVYYVEVLSTAGGNTTEVLL